MSNTSNEEISQYYSNSAGKTDANLAMDSLHLGGIAAEDYGTKVYVQNYVQAIREALINYINTQDTSMLEQAKAYTDYMISNQDFSAFAKLTDLQALRTAINAELSSINSSITNVSNRITNVINDTNSRFATNENNINQLISKYNQLFTSVSNGKSLIAGAITDMGVNTSATASFNVMAANIRKIDKSSSGGSSGGNNGGNSGGNNGNNGGNSGSSGIDTSDATATASDILSGKTAYAKGQKIYGQLVAPNSNSSNELNPYPTHDEVQLVYETIPGQITSTKTSTTTPGTLFAITPTRSHMVKYDSGAGKIKLLEYSEGTYAKVHHVDKNQYGQTIADYYTPEYTLSELGITLNADTEISDIKFSAMNNNGDESGYYCMLAICVRKKSNTLSDSTKSYTVYIYKFDTSEPGEIILEDETGSGYTLMNKYKIESSETAISDDCEVIFHPTDMRKLLLHEFVRKTNDYKQDRQTIHVINLYKYDLFNGIKYFDDYPLIQAKWYGSAALGTYNSKMINIRYINDRLITYDDGESPLSTDSSWYENINRNCQICVLNSDGTSLLNTSSTDARTAITADGLYALKYDGKFYQVIINYNNGSVSLQALTNTAVVEPSVLRYSTAAEGINIRPFYFDISNNYLIVDGNTGVKVYYIDSFDQTESLELIFSTTYNNNNYQVFPLSGNKSFAIDDVGLIGLIYPSQNTQKLLGLMYKGSMYYSSVYQNGLLTANQSDVKSGKTFIGYNGIPEVGTRGSE